MQKNIWYISASNNYSSIMSNFTFKERLGKGARLTYLDIDKITFSKSFIKMLNAEADLLLVGPRAFINGNANTKSGWRLNIDTEDISTIDIPIVVYSLGSEIKPYNESISPEAIDSIKYLADKAKWFSFRTNGLYDCFEKDLDDIYVSPDPGILCDKFNFNYQCLNNDKFKVIFNWPTDNWSRRFGKDSQKVLEDSLRLCKYIVDKHDAIIYVLDEMTLNNDNYDNRQFLYTEAKRMLEDKVCIVPKDMVELYPAQEVYVKLIASLFDQADLVIGAGESHIIPAFAQNTPFIVLGRQDEIKWLCEDMSMYEYNFKFNKSFNAMKGDIDNTINNLTDIEEGFLAHKDTMKYTINSAIDKILTI